MGQVFGLLGSKDLWLGTWGLRSLGWGKVAVLRNRDPARNYVLKKETTPISQKGVCDSLEIEL